MSDLRPKGIELELGGQKRNLLFTINVVDGIQTRCNLPLWDAMEFIAKAAAGDMDHEMIENFRSILTILLNDDEESSLTEEEVGRMLTKDNYIRVARTVLQAFGVSIPETDDEDDEDEDADPKVMTGQ